MSTFLDQKYDVRLQIERCYNCGRWWAHEVATTGTCPVCAERRIDDAELRTAAALRSVNTYKGLIKRKRKGRA